MPYDYRIDNSRRVVYTTAIGLISYDDMQSHLQNKLDAGVLSYAELIDQRQARVDISAAEVHGISAIVRSFAKTISLGPVAFVVSQDFSFGIMRMIGLQVEPFIQIETFRDLAIAEEWIEGFDVKIDQGTQAQCPQGLTELSDLP